MTRHRPRSARTDGSRSEKEGGTIGVYRGVESKRSFDVGSTRFVAALVNAPWVAMVLNFAIGAVVVSLWQPDGLAQAVAFYVLLQLATYLAITPGNLGIQELAFAGPATGMGGGAVDGVVVPSLLRVSGVIALDALALPQGGVQALRASWAAPGPCRETTAPGS